MVAELDGIVYRATGGAAKLFRARKPEILMDGPAGTGKTRAVLEYCQWVADSYPGARVLFVRKTRASMTESVLQIFEAKVLLQGAVVNGQTSRGQRQAYHYPNGSEIVCGGLDNVDRIMSTEYDVIALFEATEATENDWEKLLTRLRNGAVPFQQGLAECNPSFPGHWLKRRADEGRMTRIMSRHADNPSLTPAYLETLSRLTGHRRARLFLGQWVAAEGLIYDTFDEAVNVQPRHPLTWSGWKRFVIGIDEGYANPCAMHLYAMDGDDRLHAIAEWYKRGQLEAEVIKQAKRFCGDVRAFGRCAEVEAVVVDPSAAGLIAALNEAGLPVVEADNDVFGGIQTVQGMLAKRADGQPRFTCAPECKNMVAEFSSYMWADNKDGSKKDQPHKENDHALDELRYVANWIRAHSGSMEVVSL